MSSSTGAVNPNPTTGGPGRPKKPGWWWKRRKERLKRQAAKNVELVQENRTGAYIEELPVGSEPTATEATTAAAAQSVPNTSSVGAKKKKNKKKKKKKKVAPPESELETLPDGPLKDFFAQYEGFVYRPSKKPGGEFERLCGIMGWNRGDAERNSAWEDFGSAMASQFEAKYGRDFDDLTAWQRLCISIGITPVPTELERAREAVFNKHVNIIDLTLCPEDTVVQPQFSSESELSVYTRKRGKYPRSKAVGTLLYSLLRQIDDPPPVGSRRDSRNIIDH